MKTPKPRNTRIDLRRVRGWVNYFANYRHAVTDGGIRDWISQFKREHRDLAARVLDCVEIYSFDQIAGAFRAVLKGLDGWHRNPAQRRGKWRFVPYTASAGESGDSMIHQFRIANNLAARIFNDLFIYRSDLVRERLGSDDTVVLIDDFIGSGNQVCDAWDEQFGELLAEVGRVYLVVACACSSGIQKVTRETELQVVAPHTLTGADNIFADECRHFERSEKDILLHYCSKADANEPRGKGACGLVVVFAHGCPNNTIPILHADRNSWQGLFRRYN